MYSNILAISEQTSIFVSVRSASSEQYHRFTGCSYNFLFVSILWVIGDVAKKGVKQIALFSKLALQG